MKVKMLCFLFGGLVLVHAQNRFIPDTLNNFGFRLYKELSVKQQSNICSTFNLATALTGLLQGANRSTSEELRRTLGYNSNRFSQNQLIRYLYSILSHLKENKSGYDFSNKISVPATARILSKVKSTIENDLLIHINHENAAGKISLDTILNFDGIWKYQFDTKKTKKEPFFINHGQKTIYVPMMYVKTYFNYVYSIDMSAELIEIPFADEELTMVIILPKEIDGIERQRLYLDNLYVNQALVGLTRYGVHLRLPKFKVVTLISLTKELARLGIQKAFSPGTADFSLLDERGGISVSSVNQRISFSVTESGSMPAPPNNISDGLTPHDYDQPAMTYYTVDHPFHFLIRHKPSGTILSVGQVMSL